MTNAIIVNYDPFAMESAVYVVDDGLQKQMKVCSDIKQKGEIVEEYQLVTAIITIDNEKEPEGIIPITITEE